MADFSLPRQSLPSLNKNSRELGIDNDGKGGTNY